MASDVLFTQTNWSEPRTRRWPARLHWREHDRAGWPPGRSRPAVLRGEEGRPHVPRLLNALPPAFRRLLLPGWMGDAARRAVPRIKNCDSVRAQPSGNVAVKAGGDRHPAAWETLLEVGRKQGFEVQRREATGQSDVVSRRPLRRAL